MFDEVLVADDELERGLQVTRPPRRSGWRPAASEATGAERAQVYASLGLRLDYDPHLRQVKATADLSRVAGCARGGVIRQDIPD